MRQVSCTVQGEEVKEGDGLTSFPVRVCRGKPKGRSKGERDDDDGLSVLVP
jgi:hypothetical protein